MNKELLLQSDVLDIVFENRNKAYGAYDLRKYYNNRLNKALGIMLGLAAVVSSFAFLPKKKNDPVLYTSGTVVMGDVAKPKAKEPDVKPKPKVEQPQKNTQKWVSSFTFIKNKDSVADKLPTDLTGTAIGSATTTGTVTDGPSVVTPTGTGDITATDKPVKPAIDRTRPVDHPEIMPSYPGGMDALRKFLERNLQNPRDMEEGETVSVQVRFVVGYDGKLQGFATAGDADEAFCKEVIRVLKKMPEWIPGKANGENVSVNYVIPVKFVPAE